jgi:hypothetical protein
VYSNRYAYNNVYDVSNFHEVKYFILFFPFYCFTVTIFTINDNKFECKKCGRIFGTRSSLNTHVKVICGKPPQFKCDLCSHRTFKQKGNYKFHLLRVHNIMM